MATTAKVIGSLSEIPNINDRIDRAVSAASGRPIATPITQTMKPSRNTARAAEAGAAPMASRTPISRVRLATE